jgi:hypothetical protein
MNPNGSVLNVGWKTHVRQAIVVTVVSASKRAGGEQMSDNSEESFFEKVEEVRQEQKSGERGGFHEEVPKRAQWATVTLAFLIGGIFGAVANPADPVSGFLIISLLLGGLAWAFATESGKKFRDEVSENMDGMQQQQQQSDSNTQASQICSNCGWQNPANNNYCHDCGEELDT